MTTIPKQTQVALSYWNASTAVDGCEYVTTFQEPLTINAGDSITVRNSSLDTSLLSNDTLFFADDIELWFEFLIYTIIKKSNLDFVSGATNGKIHDGYVYGVNSSAYLNDVLINSGGDVMDYPLGEKTQLFFPNPIYQYINASLGSDYFTGGAVKLEANRFYLNFNGILKTNPNFPNQLNRLLNASTSNSSNSNATVPNATGCNEPVWLCDAETKLPIKRRVRFIVPKGSYNKSQLAFFITDKLVTIQNQNGLNEAITKYPYGTPATNPNPAEATLFMSNALTGLYPFNERGGNADVLASVGGNVNFTYQTFTQNGVNPFQAEVILGAMDFTLASHNGENTATPPLHSSLLTNFTFTNYNEIPPPYPPVNPPEPTTASPPLITDPPTKQILYSEGLCGILNNFNYMDEKRTNTVCLFRPALSDFRIMGGNSNVYPNQTDTYEDAGAGEDTFWTNTDVNYGWFQNQFDTNVTSDWSVATFRAEYDPKNPAYRTGINSPKNEDNYFLPFTYSMDAYWGFTGGLHGTNEVSLNYDPDTDRFSLQGLHTPIKCSTDATGSDATESVIKSRSFPTLPYGAGQVPLTKEGSVGGGTYPPYFASIDGTRIDVNDRQSGICFTGLKAYIDGDVTKPSNFWETLGFDVKAICIPEKYLPNATSGRPLEPLYYNEFSKYSTNTLYSIDQNISQANTQTLRNNEQLVVPDSFTMFPNPYQFVQGATFGSALFREPFFSDPVSKIGGFNIDVVYASANQQTKLLAPNPSSSVLNLLGGNILIEIVGYGSGSELQDKDAFAIKSIVSLYYLTGNTYLSSTGDGYTYYHLSTIPQTISSLKVRFLNPITKQKLTNILGNNNCVYLSIQQNKQISTEGIPPSAPQPKVPDRPEHR